MSTSSLFCAHATLRGCGSCSFSLLAFRADTKTRRTTMTTALRRSGSNDALCNTPRGSWSKIPEKTVELLSRSLVEQRRTAINKRKASELGEERDGGEKSKAHRGQQLLTLLSLTFATFVYAISPGPGLFAVLAISTRHGPIPAMWLSFGHTVGDIIYVAIAMLALNAIATG